MLRGQKLPLGQGGRNNLMPLHLNSIFQTKTVVKKSAWKIHWKFIHFFQFFQVLLLIKNEAKHFLLPVVVMSDSILF